MIAAFAAVWVGVGLLGNSWLQLLLAGALAYTSFSASTEARQPSELAKLVADRLTPYVISHYNRTNDDWA